jgi:two-component system phosphate regulon sensor histidine kinase PhoR
MLAGMEGLLVIAVAGLALALGAALLVIRRRTDELDRLARPAVGGGSGSDPAPDPGSDSGATPTREIPRDPAPAPRSVDDLLPVGLLRVDGARRVVSANPRAHALLGVAPDRLPGRSLMEAFVDARLEAMLDRIPVGGGALGEHRAGTGEPRLLVVRAHRLAADDLVVILEDTTELRHLQQIRSQFVDNISHELRTPLSTVSLLAETLALEAAANGVPARMRERIALIEVETGHLAQMVNEMLDLARIEGGTQLRLEDDVDLGRLAVSSTDRLRMFAERSGVALVVEAEPGLPTVRGDEARLGQVVVNLVHNAVKFSPDGGEVRVEVRRATGAEADVDAETIAVIDHGIGIGRADRPRVFERFYKADRARVHGGGTGLGLAIARNVVEGHGGRITLESEEGVGSTFSVTIPIVAPASAPVAPPATA